MAEGDDDEQWVRADQRERVWVTAVIAFVVGLFFGAAIAMALVYLAIHWAVFPDA